MKLSLTKKLGMLHVRGGRVLEVAHDHQVTTNTQNTDPRAAGDDGDSTKHYQDRWVTAKVGDIAVEIVSVKTSKVIGYSYLTGDAIQLHLYRGGAPAHWFKDVVAWRAYKGDPPEAASPDDAAEQFLHAAMQCKYAPVRAVAFEVSFPTFEIMDGTYQAFCHALGAEPAWITREELAGRQSAHLFGMFTTKKGRKGPVAILHSQPPKEVTKYGASGFGISLLAGSPHLVEVDVYTNVSGLAEKPPSSLEAAS